MRNAILWLEWSGLFIAIPAALALGWLQAPVLLALGVPAAAAAAWLIAGDGWDLHHLWRGSPAEERLRLPRVLWRVAPVGLALLTLLWLVYPQRLFELPAERPALWAALLLTYPVISVYPQELIYRAFFFHRYRRLFRGRRVMITASALAFAWMHVVFGNGWAMLFTLVGGFLFAHSYAHAASLRLVWLEHSLYGMLLFTIGWSDFFLYRVG